MAQGFSNITIAEKLVVKEKSVENYINIVFRKTGVSITDPTVDARVQCVLLYQINTQDFNNPVENYFDSCKSAPFSPRQKDVVRLIGKGYSNIAIARELNLSIKTVENQINIVLRDRIPVDHQTYNPRVVIALVAQTRHVIQ